MRIYPARDEECVRLQALVREWTRSGLLSEAQQTAADRTLRTDLTRTNTMLRAGLALFTAIVVAASLLLVATQTAHDRTTVSALLVIWAVICYAGAEWLVATFKLYRYGVEEMLAVAAAVLLAAGALSMSEGRAFDHRMAVALTVGAAAAFGVYRRFGFVYAAIGAMACGVAVPFQLDVSPAWRHLVAATGFAAAGIVARSKQRQHGDDFLGDEYAALQAAAFAGVYLALNLKILNPPDIFWASHPPIGRGFYWFTYFAIWLLPPAGLWLGVRDRQRWMIDVGIAAALATLISNKPYLGWARQPWDPILLGVLLAGGAILLRRWLAHAPGGERRGFTGTRILAYESDALARLGTVTVGVPRAPEVSSAEPPPSPFGGGRSGGGGGGGEF